MSGRGFVQEHREHGDDAIDGRDDRAGSAGHPEPPRVRGQDRPAWLIGLVDPGSRLVSYANASGRYPTSVANPSAPSNRSGCGLQLGRGSGPAVSVHTPSCAERLRSIDVARDADETYWASLGWSLLLGRARSVSRAVWARLRDRFVLQRRLIFSHDTGMHVTTRSTDDRRFTA